MDIKVCYSNVAIEVIERKGTVTDESVKWTGENIDIPSYSNLISREISAEKKQITPNLGTVRVALEQVGDGSVSPSA
jgi:hypothetical protein